MPTRPEISVFRNFFLVLLILAFGCATKRATTPDDRVEPGSAGAEYPGLSSLGDDLLYGVDTSEPFEVRDHIAMIREGRVPSWCTDALASAQWRQDLLLALDAAAHFDNCRFQDSYDYMRRLLDEAEQAGDRGERESMLSSIGFALHGIQDFYSHTNYVELMTERYSELDAVPLAGLWSDRGKQTLMELVSSKLVSGTVWWEPGNVCEPSVPSHRAFNKDSNNSQQGAKYIERWRRTHYQAARELARRETDAVLRHYFGPASRWAPLVADCKGVLGYLVHFDQRPDEPQRQ